MRQIRASFTESTIRVYQAYNNEIADSCLRAQTFVPPFKTDRMTWIKPSFLWMMYRSGWGTKPNQERILAVDISTEGFEWALSHACLTHYDPVAYASEDEWLQTKARSAVRVQWDPDRSPTMEKLQIRAIQVGLSGAAMLHYARDWTKTITDMTDFAHTLYAMVCKGDESSYKALLPKETVYQVHPTIGDRIGISPVG